jgi:hypothetical protein
MAPRLPHLNSLGNRKPLIYAVPVDNEEEFHLRIVNPSDYP